MKAEEIIASLEQYDEECFLIARLLIAQIDEAHGSVSLGLARTAAATGKTVPEIKEMASNASAETEARLEDQYGVSDDPLKAFPELRGLI